MKYEIEAFCANVIKMQKKVGLTRREMATVMGIGMKSYEMLEQGRLSRRIGFSTLVRLAEYFGVSCDEWFTDIEETKISPKLKIPTQNEK